MELKPGGVDLAIRYGRRDALAEGLDVLLVGDLAVYGTPELVGSREVSGPADLVHLPWLQELGTNEVADWNPPDSIVEYRLSGADLLREDKATGDVFLAASGVEAFAVTDIGGGLRIELTLRRRDLTRTYTFVSQDPS